MERAVRSKRNTDIEAEREMNFTQPFSFEKGFLYWKHFCFFVCVCIRWQRRDIESAAAADDDCQWNSLQMTEGAKLVNAVGPLLLLLLLYMPK